MSSRAALAALAVVLAGCAAPEEVEARHREEVETYRSDMADAVAWDHHVLGIPASGWVGLIIIGGLIAAVLAAAAGVWIYRVQERRARYRHDIETARISRGRCAVCGADPDVDAPAAAPG